MKKDFEDRIYEIYYSERRSVSVRISDNKLSLSCEDHGPECVSMTGKYYYDFHYHLNEEDTEKLISALRKKDGYNVPLKKILTDNFGSDDGPEVFIRFSNRIKIHPMLFSL